MSNRLLGIRRRYLFLILFLFVLGIAIGVILPTRDQNAERLRLHILESVIEESFVPLKDIFSGQFNKFCIFLPDSSMPEDGVRWANNLIDEKKLNGNEIKRSSLLVFMLVRESNYTAYNYRGPFVRKNQNKYTFSFISEEGRRLSEGFRCVNFMTGGFELFANKNSDIKSIVLIEERH